LRLHLIDKQELALSERALRLRSLERASRISDADDGNQANDHSPDQLELHRRLSQAIPS
jgi:hypothetical protein